MLSSPRRWDVLLTVLGGILSLAIAGQEWVVWHWMRAPGVASHDLIAVQNITACAILGVALIIGLFVGRDVLMASPGAWRRLPSLVVTGLLLIVILCVLMPFYARQCVETGWTEYYYPPRPIAVATDANMPNSTPVEEVVVRVSISCGYRRVWSWLPVISGVALLVVAGRMWSRRAANSPSVPVLPPLANRP